MVSVGNEDRKHVAYTLIIQRMLDLLRVGVRKLGSRRRQQSCGILVLSLGKLWVLRWRVLGGGGGAWCDDDGLGLVRRGRGRIWLTAGNYCRPMLLGYYTLQFPAAAPRVCCETVHPFTCSHPSRDPRHVLARSLAEQSYHPHPPWILSATSFGRNWNLPLFIRAFRRHLPRRVSLMSLAALCCCRKVNWLCLS